MNDFSDIKLSRRELLIAGALSASATVVPGLARAQDAGADVGSETTVNATISFHVNGQLHELNLDTRTTLLDALREHLHLNGTKKAAITASAALVLSSSMVDASIPA